ncbi:MAG: hypothetical protein EZS28_031150 [Streblomastix strix]|uniref:Uncharacterized protein n=1 Tax=Streblomastix strix TaxID=222440 RepID=A0A5J4USX3_9EUKA|nr:MAG: hypothetical protein EZS28_031150 [Streblomastix strix]
MQKKAEVVQVTYEKTIKLFKDNMTCVGSKKQKKRSNHFKKQIDIEPDSKIDLQELLNKLKIAKGGKEQQKFYDP